MKIAIYQANREVPFATLYNQLGANDKILFSNREARVTDFNNKRVEELGRSIRPLLPHDKMIGSEEDETIFYIPSEMEDKLIQVFKHLFKGSKPKTEEETSVPNNGQALGLGGGGKLASFVDDMKIEEVLVMARDDVKKELEKLFNSISEEDNEIDAVLVCTYLSSANKMSLACSSDPKPGDRNVNTRAYTTQLRNLIPLLADTKKVNAQIGSLSYVAFQYSNGIIHITHLPQYGDYTFLVFVSATKEGIEMLEYFREQYFSKIEPLLDQLFEKKVT
jgi:hypothetical protein